MIIEIKHKDGTNMILRTPSDEISSDWLEALTGDCSQLAHDAWVTGEAELLTLNGVRQNI